MRSTIMSVLANTPFAVTGAASAYEAFDAYTDPTLPTVVTGNGHAAGTADRGRSLNAPARARTTLTSNQEGNQGTHQLVLKRSASLPHQVAHGFDRAHSSQVN
jgi:hypothetical protein